MPYEYHWNYHKDSRRKANELTQELYKLIEEEPDSENNETLFRLLEADRIFRSDKKLETLAINFEAHIKIDSATFVSPLIATFSHANIKKIEYLQQLALYVLMEVNNYDAAEKNQILLETLGMALGWGSLTMFQALYAILPPSALDFNTSITAWFLPTEWNALALKLKTPLGIALFGPNPSKEMGHLLLINNADPDFVEPLPQKSIIDIANEIFQAKTLGETNPVDENLLKTLECARFLQKAKKETIKEKYDIAVVMENFAKAMQYDHIFIRSYIAHHTRAAIEQNNHASSTNDLTDYRFLKAFIQNFYYALRMDVSDKYRGLKEFQDDVIAHIFAGYEVKDTYPDNFPVLFKNEEERRKFLADPVVPALIFETRLEAAKKFQEQPRSANDNSSLAQSMSRGVFAVASRNPDQERDIAVEQHAGQQDAEVRVSLQELGHF